MCVNHVSMHIQAQAVPDPLASYRITTIQPCSGLAAALCCLSNNPEERAALSAYVCLVGLATAGERVAFKVAIDQVCVYVCMCVTVRFSWRMSVPVCPVHTKVLRLASTLILPATRTLHFPNRWSPSASFWRCL